MGVITISRQYGAGGLTLGKMLAEKLDYALFDNEIIQMVANKAKVSTDWVTSVEKEAGGKFQKFLSTIVSKSLVDRILDDQRGYIDEEIYVDLLHQIITKIADEGNVVIIGRGSQYILREREDTKSILLVADLEDRIKFIEEHYDRTYAQATQVVLADDKRRINLYRKFGKEDYNQPGLYDIVLNMSRLKLNKACELVCRLIGSK